MGSFTNGTPYPTDQGPDPASDVPAVNSFSPTGIALDVGVWAAGHTDELKKLGRDITDPMALFSELASLFIKIAGQLYLELLSTILNLETGFFSINESLYQKTLDLGVGAAQFMVGKDLGLVVEALGGHLPKGYEIPQSTLAKGLDAVYSSLISPFNLLDTAFDPREVGSGKANAEFLLKRALTLSMSEYILDTVKDLTGFGWVKTILPLVGFVDRSINPSNVVRQAMEQGYSYLMKAPLQRDLNHQYPIKDLGVSAQAKAFIRGSIDQQAYLDKCLDAGLDNSQAQQLIIESARLLSESQIATLVNHQYITQDDARERLAMLGYEGSNQDVILYLFTHARYFSIQERVGNQAVTAWKHGTIDQATLESILQQLGYNSDEIQLLEIEQAFVSQTTNTETLSYSKVQQLFEANLVDVDYVINYLTQQGFSSDDTRLLVLLDFTKAEERAAREALLTSRIRVEEEHQLVLAQQEAAKNETELAKARQALASELDSYQKTIGQLQALPGILSLLGISL